MPGCVNTVIMRFPWKMRSYLVFLLRKGLITWQCDLWWAYTWLWPTRMHNITASGCHPYIIGLQYIYIYRKRRELGRLSSDLNQWFWLDSMKLTSNECQDISIFLCFNCVLSCLFRLTWKERSKLRIPDLLWGESNGHKGPAMRKVF